MFRKGSKVIFGVPEHDIYRIVYAYAKVYRDMTKIFEYNRPIKVRKPGYEARTPERTGKRKPFSDPVGQIMSLRRTKTRLSDIVINNDFDLFCTFTFAEDRDNIGLIKRRMQFWLSHQQQRTGKFAYVIVPEFHKKCAECADAHLKTCPHDDRIKPIHFHALFKGYKGSLTRTNLMTPKTKQRIYNIPSYTLGYSTAVKITDIHAVGSYIKKYITKDMPQFNGKKRYWCSQGLDRPKKVINPVIFPSDMEKFGEAHQTTNFRVHTAAERIDFTESQD